MSKENDVNQDSSPEEEEETTDIEDEESPEEVEEEEEEESEKGSKTPPENLYAALEEERTHRKRLNEEIKELREKLEDNSSYSSGVEDEADLQKRLAKLEEERAVDKVLQAHPELKDRLSDFNSYRKDYPLDKIESAAKLYLVENDLLETKSKRKGLEKKTGGGKSAPSSGYTLEQVKELRENDNKKYMKLLLAGKFDKIKE